MFAENISKNIDRITYDNIHRVGGNRCNLGNNALRYIDIGLSKVKTGLSGTSGNTGGKNHNIRISGVLVITGINIDRSYIGSALTDIHRLSQRLFFIYVDHYDFRSISADCKRVCNCRADISRTDYGNFSSHFNEFLSRRTSFILKIFAFYIIIISKELAKWKCK